MTSSLHFLDGKSREQIVAWLRDALLEKTSVPREYHDQPVAGAISAAAPALGDQARTDLSAAAIQLLAEIRTGRHKHDYVASLLRLITDLDLRSGAIPILRELTVDIPALKDRLGWETCCDILFTQLNLRDLQNSNYWLRIWEYNKRCFSPVTLAALFDLDPKAALDFLPDLPNSSAFGDLTAMTLDHAADTYPGRERTLFREAIAAVASLCQPQIRQAINLWLSETQTAPTYRVRDLSSLYAAFSADRATVIDTPAKLCEPPKQAA